jgi:hypothetical protein
MKRSFQDVLDLSRQRHVNMRTAAYMLTVRDRSISALRSSQRNEADNQPNFALSPLSARRLRPGSING